MALTGDVPQAPASRALRFDHVVIGTADLEASGAVWEALGFVVEPGGVHPGRGTRNALIRVAGGYIELLEVHDPAEARTAGGTPTALAAFIDRNHDGLATYALATEELDSFAAAWRERGLPVTGPTPASRHRPDGSVLRWRTIVPGTTTIGTPWPFLIEWGGEHPTTGRPTPAHPNGALGVAGLSIALGPVVASGSVAGMLGSTLVRGPSGEAVVPLGDVTLSLWAPRDPVPREPGPFGLDVRVADLARAASIVRTGGFDVEEEGRVGFRVVDAGPAADFLRFVPSPEPVDVR